MKLKPLPGRVLVELREKYQHVATTAQKYDTKTSGIAIAVWNDSLVERDLGIIGIIGKVVFWEEYKDGAVIERDGKRYAFIKIEDLDGYEDEQSE